MDYVGYSTCDFDRSGCFTLPERLLPNFPFLIAAFTSATDPAHKALFLCSEENLVQLKREYGHNFCVINKRDSRSVYFLPVDTCRQFELHSEQNLVLLGCGAVIEIFGEESYRKSMNEAISNLSTKEACQVEIIALRAF